MQFYYATSGLANFNLAPAIGATFANVHKNFFLSLIVMTKYKNYVCIKL